MARPHMLALAGFAATAVSFGPGRIGFGLFLPRLRDSFELTAPEAGLITSLTFASFLLALPASIQLTRRAGPRLPVMLGALLAMAGFLLVMSASEAAIVSAGVALAGASAGLCWTPFNNAAEQGLTPRRRAHVLSAVSTGAAVGVSLAACCYLATLFADLSWRPSWAVFATMAAIALVMARIGLPCRRSLPGEAFGAPSLHPRLLLQRRAAPLYAAALGFGAVNAVYLSYASLHVASQGGLSGLADAAAAAVIYLVYGLCGLTGLAMGWIEARIGIAKLLAGIFGAFSASLGLIAAGPTAWGAVLVSAGLHGAAVMGISAVLSFWSLRLFPGLGTSAFTAALIAVALGSIAGPAAGGALAKIWGAGLSLAAAAFAALIVAGAFLAAALRRGGFSAPWRSRDNLAHGER